MIYGLLVQHHVQLQVENTVGTSNYSGVVCFTLHACMISYVSPQSVLDRLIHSPHTSVQVGNLLLQSQHWVEFSLIAS